MFRQRAGWILLALTCGCASSRQEPADRCEPAPRGRAGAFAVLLVKIAQWAVHDVVPLEHAEAVEVASILRELSDASRHAASMRGCALFRPGEEPANCWSGWESTSQELQVIAIPGTNSLLLTPASETDRVRLREVIARLDQTPGRPR